MSKVWEGPLRLKKSESLAAVMFGIVFASICFMLSGGIRSIWFLR